MHIHYLPVNIYIYIYIYIFIFIFNYILVYHKYAEIIISYYVYNIRIV